MSANSFAGLYAVCGSFMGLSALTVGLRFYSRARKSFSAGIDDYTALFGVITFVAACACMIQVSILGGQGYSHGNNDSFNAKTVIQLSIAFDFMQMNTLACAKLSALFLYRRIFRTDCYPWFKYALWGTVTIIAMWYITFDVLSVTQCPKFSDYWESTNFSQECTRNLVWANGLAVSDLILDVWVCLLPAPFIWNLHATLAKKVGIFGVFLLAFVGIGASIARIVFFFSYGAPGRQVIYVGLLESGMTITVVNLPSCWWLFSSTIPEKLGESLHTICSLGSGSSEDSGTITDPMDQPCRPMQRHDSVVKSYCSASGRKASGGDIEEAMYERDETGLVAPNVIEVEHTIEIKHSD